MSGNVEDVISKMQCILDNFFSLLGSFAFDKAKEYLDKERDAAVKNHSVAPFFNSALAAFSVLASAEKNYANFLFLGSKGFLRKDFLPASRSLSKFVDEIRTLHKMSSLKSMYETLYNEYQRLEEKHYITPVSTPTMSPTSSCRTPSPSPSSGLPSPSPISACSEVSGSLPSTISVGSSARGSIQSYLGEDILENLASHLCGQLLCFVKARMKTMEFYEKLHAMSSSRFLKYDILLNGITEIVKLNVKLFHHPMLSPLKSSFSYECEILMKLLEAEINMQNWRFLPSLLCLHDAHSKLGAWISMSTEIKKVSSSNTFRVLPTPPLYNWLRDLKHSLVSKFTLYFHEILSKHATPGDMVRFCSKTHTDYINKITAFQKRYDVACVAIVLDTNGLDDYRGHGYISSERHYEAPKGLDSFPPIVTYPPNCFTQEKHMSHWPSVVMIMNNKEQEIRSTDSAVFFYDTRMNATYFMSRIESRMTLVFIFESKKTDKDTHIHKFMQSLCLQLRGNKLYARIKPGSK